MSFGFGHSRCTRPGRQQWGRNHASAAASGESCHDNIWFFYSKVSRSPGKGLTSFVDVKRQDAGHHFADVDTEVAQLWSQWFWWQTSQSLDHRKVVRLGASTWQGSSILHFLSITGAIPYVNQFSIALLQVIPSSSHFLSAEYSANCFLHKTATCVFCHWAVTNGSSFSTISPNF